MPIGSPEQAVCVASSTGHRPAVGLFIAVGSMLRASNTVMQQPSDPLHPGPDP